jgi:hypothetical protein
MSGTPVFEVPAEPSCARCSGSLVGLNGSFCSDDCQYAEEQRRLEAYPDLVSALERIAALDPAPDLYALAVTLGRAKGIAQGTLTMHGPRA